MKKMLVWLLSAAGVIAGSAAYLHSQFPDSPHRVAITGAIDDLTSCDYEVRDQAAVILKQAGAESVPYLVRALHRRDPPLARYWTRLPFIRYRPANSAPIRERAAEQLALFAKQDDRALSALIFALRDDNPEAQRALRKIAPIQQLTAALEHRDVRIRRGAAEVLADLGPQARESAAALVRLLRDKDETVRTAAAHALGAINDPSATEGLVAALRDRLSSVRAASAVALGRMRAEPAIAPLTAALADPDGVVRVKAAQALWRIDRRGEPLLPVLTKALRDRTASSDAKFVLGEIGPDAKPAVPALVQALREERVGRPLRTPPSSALALGRIGAAAVPELITALKNEHAEVRTSAVIALGFVGKPAQDAVPFLMPLLADNNLEVRQATTLSIGAIQPDNRALLPVLKQLARDDDIFLASAASAMLRQLDPAAAVELGLE